MKKFLYAFVMSAIFGSALAQQPPYAATSTITSGVIAVTNTYQVLLPLQRGRLGCTIQNNGTNTMYIYLDNTGGAVAPSGIVTALKLVAGQTMNCAIGGVAVVSDQIWITGTAADTFVVTRQ